MPPQKTFDRVVCPCCRMNFLVQQKDGTRADFTKFDVDEASFIMVQTTKGGKIAGTGKGYRGSGTATGFQVLERMTLEEAYNTHKYDDIIDTLKQQNIDIIRKLIQLGLLSKHQI